MLHQIQDVGDNSEKWLYFTQNYLEILKLGWIFSSNMQLFLQKKQI